MSLCQDADYDLSVKLARSKMRCGQSTRCAAEHWRTTVIFAISERRQGRTAGEQHKFEPIAPL